MAEATQVERWLPIAGYEGSYEVSDQGRVRSLDRMIDAHDRVGRPIRYLKRGQILRQKRKNDPLKAYANVILSINSCPDTRQVHRLVLEAFVGPCPLGMVACHGPNGLFDNSLSNLRWDTDRENALDRVRHGNHHLVNRERCPRGHELAPPNLHPWQVARGQRKCYACALTVGWGTYRGYRQSDPEWTSEANRRYAEILHFGEPIRYSRGPHRPRWLPKSA